MTSFTSSEKPVAAAAAGAFALAVAYFSYASAKNAAAAAKASSTSAGGVASPLSTSSPSGGGARKAPVGGNSHVDPASLGANNPGGFIFSNSEDDYSPSILDNTGETVASFAPEPFPDADVAAFFAAFGVPSVGKKEDADEKSAGDDGTSANAASTSTVSSSFVTAGRTSEDVMAQCGALMASDAAFDGLKADAATDVVERAANLLAYVEWRNNQQQLEQQQRSKSDEAVISSPPEQAAATSSDAVTAPPVSSSPSGSTSAPVPSQEQLSALSTLVDARVDTIEKWREHEAPIIRSVVRMLRDVREELANIDHYKADGHDGEGNSATAQKTVAVDKTDKQQAAVVADGGAAVSKDADARAPDVSPPSVVAADAGVAAGGEGEGEDEGEEHLVKRRNSIHPELVARTAVDIRERIRRLRGILEKLHTPLRELGPIGDLCNQLEAIASVLAGSD